MVDVVIKNKSNYKPTLDEEKLKGEIVCFMDRS